MVNGVLSETFLFGFSLSPAHELASLCIQQSFENYPDTYFLYIGLKTCLYIIYLILQSFLQQKALNAKEIKKFR